MIFTPFSVFTGATLELLAPDLLTARFSRPTPVLSDAAFNGGWAVVSAVANHQMGADAISTAVEQTRYCAGLLARHGLAPDTPLQLTAALVARAGCHQVHGDRVRVTAWVSAGVKHNAVCAGDPPQYDESAENEYIALPVGTINAAVFVEARLAPAVFPHIFTVVAEAKADLLRQRTVRSCYSPAFATGTGTDSTLVASDPSAIRTFSTASTHCWLGATVAQAVRAALEQALHAEAAANPPGGGHG